MFVQLLMWLLWLQCYLQDIDLELAALEESNRTRQAELSAYAELDNIAEEDEQDPPGWCWMHPVQFCGWFYMMNFIPRVKYYREIVRRGGFNCAEWNCFRNACLVI